jgi:hypothetical protein
MSDECLICYNNKKKFKILHDNHKVCIECFKKLNKPSCPFCRTEIKLFEEDKVNKYTKHLYINTDRIERRRLKRNRRKNFINYDEYLDHRRKIKIRYKDAHLKKYST